MSGGALEGAVTTEAARRVVSEVSALLGSSDDVRNAPEVAAEPSRRGFNGKRNDEAPSVRAKRLRIESGEQQLPTHLVAEVHYGRGRVVVCACGFRGTGTSDQAMAEAFANHAR